MSKNDIFFEKKKEWSLIKDQILACYLEPYMNKILMKKEPVRYIDTFAGEGKFEDGTEGSPLIAIHAVQNALEVSKSGNHDVRLFFIEKYRAFCKTRNEAWALHVYA